MIKFIFLRLFIYFFRFWFHFTVENTQKNQRVIFNVVNLSKLRTLFGRCSVDSSDVSTSTLISHECLNPELAKYWSKIRFIWVLAPSDFEHTWTLATGNLFKVSDVVTNWMPFCSTFSIINHHSLEGQINSSLVLYSCIITPSFKFPDNSYYWICQCHFTFFEH